MPQTSDLLFAGAILLVFAVGWLLGQWQRLYKNRLKIAGMVTRLTPDAIDPVVLWAINTAFEAVEQRAQSYLSLSKEEKLVLGQRYMVELMNFIKSGKLTDLTSEALLESKVYREKQMPGMKLMDLDKIAAQVDELSAKTDLYLDITGKATNARQLRSKGGQADIGHGSGEAVPKA